MGLNRIRSVTEDKLREQEAGFRKGRSTRDQIFAHGQTFEKEKKDIYKIYFWLSVTYKKGFWASTRLLWNPTTNNVLKILYEEGCCKERHEEQGEWFEIKTGVGHGCALLPMLFNVLLEQIMDKVLEGGQQE